MKNRTLKERLAMRKAVEVLESHGYTELPINPITIAESNDIVVQAGDTKEFSGALINKGSLFGILYSTSINNEGFQRFTVAHELGHYFLEGHPDILFENSECHYSNAGNARENEIERQADSFASSLLMPEFLLKPELEELEKIGLEAIKLISQLSKTSLIASAIRYLDLVEHEMAVIVSKDGIIEYCLTTEELYNKVKFRYLKEGDRLPHGVPSLDCCQKDREIQESTQINNWFDVDWEFKVEEDAIHLGSYGKVLTILSFETELLEDAAY